MTEENEILAKLSDAEVTQFKTLMAARDEAALKAGVATLEANRTINTMQNIINESIRQERQLMEAIIKNHNIDTNEYNFSIDYENGEIIKA